MNTLDGPGRLAIVQSLKYAAMITLVSGLMLDLSAQNQVRVEPVPGWVAKVDLPPMESVSLQDTSDGFVALLVDEQYDVASQSSFMHYARQILDLAALQDESKLSWGFDPSYQVLRVHYALLRRGNTRINLLERQKINVLQREQNLEYNLYDGRLTAVLLLEDVRIGDILEYAYSYVGDNPVFEGRFMGSFRLQWRVPVCKTYYRLMVPHGRNIQIAYHRLQLSPIVKRFSKYNEYVWDRDDVEGLHPDPGLPQWYSPFPWIQLSEFSTWNEIATWASHLFRLSENESAVVSKTAAHLNINLRTIEDSVQAAIRFVQDDIRYFGMEIGINSHKPNPPSKILTQRLGDCKDKALLLCTLLQAEGIVAQPVLVNTELRGEVSQMHPSPLAFNHVIVRMQVNDQDYFIDPTLTHQRGSLSKLCLQNNTKGLVVSPASSELVDIRSHCESFSRMEIEEFFSIPSFDGPATLKAITQYHGQMANEMRGYYAQTSAKELEEGGHDYYAKEYQHVTTKKQLGIESDNQSDNVLTLSEEYTIDSIWQKSSNTDRVEASFYATLLRERLYNPPSSDRTMPMGIRHPINVKYKSSVSLPESWDVEGSGAYVQDSAFWFASSSKWERNNLEIEYQYRTIRDWVPPEQIHAHRKNVTEALGHIGYTLYKYGGTSANISGVFVIVVGVGLAFGIAIMVITLRRAASRSDLISAVLTVDSASPETINEPPPGPPQLVGFRGWLLLPAIGLVTSPLVVLVTVLQTFPAIFNRGRWEALTTPGLSEYHPMFGPIIAGELFINIILILFTITTAILFFKRKREAPRFAIIWLVASSSLPIVDAIVIWFVGLSGTSSPDVGVREVGRLVSSLAIWLPYFLVSERVKATFVQ